MLRIENLTVKFQSLVAVNNLSMKVEQGNIHSLIGLTALARPQFSTQSSN